MQTMTNSLFQIPINSMSLIGVIALELLNHYDNKMPNKQMTAMMSPKIVEMFAKVMKMMNQHV